MTSKTLQMIAKVKMHLCDSHTASWNMKQQSCMKWQFGPLSSARERELSLWATPSSASSSMPPPPASGKDVNTENDLHPIGFWEMIEDFNSLAADDADLNVEEMPIYAWNNRSICDLFDFDSNHWAKEHRRKCSNCEDYAVAPLFFLNFSLIIARPPVLSTTLNCIIMPHNYYDNTWHVLMVKIPCIGYNS